jgi:TatD DNase family protein
MFDSHGHLYEDRLAADLPRVVEHAQMDGMRGVLLAGETPSTWRAQAVLRARFHSPTFCVGLAYGVHPVCAAAMSAQDLSHALSALHRAVRGQPVSDSDLDSDLAGLPAPNAVGELGLDLRHPATRGTLPKQTRAFSAQLALAREQNLPVVLHIVSAHADALRLLKQEGLPAAGGVVHSFSGSAEVCREYLSLGLCMSFSGALARSSAPKLARAARTVPLDRLLVETDVPFQTPAQCRPAPGQTASAPFPWSAVLSAVLSALSLARNEPISVLSEHTERNARALFRLPSAPQPV